MMNLCGKNIMHDNTQTNLGGLPYRSFRAVIGAGKLQIENKHLKKYNCRGSQYYSKAHILRISMSALVFSTAELFLVSWYNNLLINKVSDKIISILRVIHSTSNSSPTLWIPGPLNILPAMLDVEGDALWKYQYGSVVPQ